MRVSATNIDAFRRWRDNEDADLDELIAQLRKELPPTEPMLAGSAFHKALEHAEYGEAMVLEADGYRFDLDLDGELDLPAIRELKATREYVIDGEPVTLVCVADTMHGRRVDDHKFTGRFDPERFMAGYQWRVNLEVFEADEFRWNVFEGSPVGDRHYRIHALHTLAMRRYPGMGNDVVRELGEFLDFARIHLPERFQQEAA